MKVFKIVDDNLATSGFSAINLCQELGVSRTQLHNKIKALTGDGASVFIRNIRLDRAVDMLRSGKYTITETLYSVGFTSPAYFSKVFRERFGKSPSDFMKGR